jgi:hypothetical protein
MELTREERERRATIPLLRRLVFKRHRQEQQRSEANTRARQLLQEVDELDVYNMERLQVELEALDLRMEISPHQRTSSSPISSKSPTRGATPTSLRSSRLSYYPDDGCCSTAGPDVESYSEPLELVGPGGGRS